MDNSNSNNLETIRTGNFIMAGALASVDPLRTTIEIEPEQGSAEWRVACVVKCPNARALWARLHPAIGKPVDPPLTNPIHTGLIIQAITRTQGRLRDKVSTLTRINCWEVCNG